MFSDIHHDRFSLISHQPAKYIADPQASEVHLFVDLEDVAHHLSVLELALLSRADSYLKLLIRRFPRTNVTEKRIYSTVSYTTPKHCSNNFIHPISTDSRLLLTRSYVVPLYITMVFCLCNTRSDRVSLEAAPAQEKGLTLTHPATVMSPDKRPHASKYENFYCCVIYNLSRGE